MDYSSFNEKIHVPSNAISAAMMLRKFYALAKRNGRYAMDTETSGLLWTEDNLYMVSLYTEGMSLVLPLAWQKPALSVADLAGLTNELVSDKDLHVFLHNAKFDMHFLKNHGVELHNKIHDTCVAGFVLNVEKPAGLKARARVELGLEMAEFKDKFPLRKGKNAKRLIDYPALEVAKYAALDTFATYGLAEKFLRKSSSDEKMGQSLVLNAQELEMRRLYDRVESRMILPMFDMERIGMMIDVAALTKYRKEYEDKLVQLEKDILQEAGMAFNMNSPKQVKEVFSRRGVILKSTDEANLKLLMRKTNDKLAKLMLQYRGDFKILTTYINAVLAHKDADDRIHTSLNLHVAGTGRISSSNPHNLFN